RLPFTSAPPAGRPQLERLEFRLPGKLPPPGRYPPEFRIARRLAAGSSQRRSGSWRRRLPVAAMHLGKFDTATVEWVIPMIEISSLRLRPGACTRSCDATGYSSLFPGPDPGTRAEIRIQT